MEIIKQITMKFFKKLFSSDQTMKATKAFALAKYGSFIDDKSLCENWIRDTNALIRYKCENQDFSTIIECKYPELKGNLINYYENLGYFVMVVNKDTDPRIKGEFIIISWNQ